MKAQAQINEEIESAYRRLVDPLVHHYRGDIEHDIEWLRSTGYAPCIIIARDTGTDLVPMLPADHPHWPGPGERVRIFFGSGNRSDLLRSSYSIALYSARRHAQGERRTALAFNGTTWRQIDMDKIVGAVSAYVAAVEAEWKRTG